MYFFFLFTQQQKERKSTKKKEKPKQYSNILTSIHSFGCVSLFGYAESLQPRKLGHSPQTMLGKIICGKNTAERQAEGLARLRVRACPPEENG